MFLGVIKQQWKKVLFVSLRLKFKHVMQSD